MPARPAMIAVSRARRSRHERSSHKKLGRTKSTRISADRERHDIRDKPPPNDRNWIVKPASISWSHESKGALAGFQKTV